jgi:mRNA-degrading endonuclease RelE of RelBE toxin-antitoxin system
MSYRVIIASAFGKEVRRIAKKHPGIKSDIGKLITDLEINPIIGTNLGQNFYKIRRWLSPEPAKESQVESG